MKFHEYPSMPHHERESDVEYVHGLLQDGQLVDEWIVMEKLHGANLSFRYDGNEIRCAKRTSFLEPHERTTFYNVQRLWDRKSSQITSLLENIWQSEGAQEAVVVYGELIGGHYPKHKTPSELRKIQAGVWYFHEIDRVPFDVYVDDHFLPIQHTLDYATKNKLTPVPVLGSGTLDETLAWDIGCASQMPTYYGLPELEENVMEGVIIRNVKQNRAFKKKNLKFKEVARKHRIKKPQPQLSNEGKSCREAMEGFVEEEAIVNRIETLVSKHGPDVLDNTGKASGLLAKDMLADIVQDVPCYEGLEKEDKKLLNKSINRACGLSINRYVKWKSREG